MRLSLDNLSSLPREAWAVVTFPTPLVANFGAECTFQTDAGVRFRAVRGRTRGMKTVYRVRALMSGHQHLEGTLLNEPHVTAGPLEGHAWVADNIPALLPSLGVRIGTRDYWDREHTGPVLVDHSAAHHRWWLKRWIPELGVIMEWWADIQHQDPVIPFFGKIVWSQPGVPDHNRVFDFLALKSGELTWLDFGTRHGALIPSRDPQGMWLTVLNTTPITLNDGSGLPLSGSMLAFTDNPQLAQNSPGDHMDPNHWVNRGIRDLRAAMEAPIVGAALGVWDGYWLANKNVPRFGPGYTSRKNIEWQQFVDNQRTPANWFVDRPYGIGRSPGMTGDQEDFGATKGTYVVTEHDPRFIHAYRYCVQTELFRGMNLYELDGMPLRLAQHPNWVTWSGGTHWSAGVSPDRLGKSTLVVPPPGTGYYGYDDQHRSQHLLAAYLTLSDDPLAEDQLKHQATMDSASYRLRYPNNGSDAARAQGRTAGAWANFLTVTDGPERQVWANMLAVRMNVNLANPSLNVSGPMKVLAWGGPDGRKAVFNADGSLAPWVSLWEHGLAAVGLYATAKQGNVQAQEMLRRISRTLATFGFFRENGTWYTVADIIWRDGAAPAEGLKRGREMTTGGGVDTWTFAGILVAREVLKDEPATLARLNEYVLAVTGGQEAAERRTAEWWAAVEGIQIPV